MPAAGPDLSQNPFALLSLIALSDVLTTTETELLMIPSTIFLC